MRELDVERVVERACAGEQEAQAELYRRFAPRVFGLCRHLLGRSEAAEEATSEVFLRVQRSLRRYNSSLPFQNWLFSVAGHFCIDELRKGRREQQLGSFENAEADAATVPAPSPLSEVLMKERRQEVQKAIAKLPEKYRLPLVLKYYGDLSYDEIAGQLGLARAHVATLIFRAKLELRLKLTPGKGGLVA